MHFRGIGTALPSARYTKTQCLEAFRNSDWFDRLDARSRLLASNVLQRDNGIESRRLAVNGLDEVFQIDPNTLAQRFRTHAPALAIQAGERALVNAGLSGYVVDDAPDGWWWLSSFGAGFCCHGALLKVH